MQRIEIKAERSYQVLIDCNWSQEVSRITRDRSRVAIVVAASLRDFVETIDVGAANLHIFEVADGEEGKSPQTLSALWEWLGAGGFTRSDLLIAIGGGSTTDIAGFAAATWLRGIEWVAIPTTLAGMVDAAIGGKTGMNSSFGKNLIGAFHSPLEVLIDLDWLESLSDRDFAAGLAEVVKCGFISDPQILTLCSNTNTPEIRKDRTKTIDLITRSVTVKASVVGRDFKESFEREILNYGHTVGHAVELESHFQLRHGEAVAIGMVYAAELSHQRGLLSQELVDQHRKILQSLGLPVSYPLKAWPKILESISLDKKSRGRAIRFVGIDAVGSTLRIEDVSNEELAMAYERLNP